MKILLVHNFYGSSAPSGENIVYCAERDLLRDKGHTVIEFTRHSDELYQAGLSGRVKGALCTPWNPLAARTFSRMAQREKPDIIHVHNTFPIISPAIFHATSGLPAAVVLTLHNYRIFCAAAVPLRAHSPCTECLDRRSVIPSLRHGCYRGSRLATLPVASMVALHRTANTWVKGVDAFITLSEFQKSKLVQAGLPDPSVHVKPHFYRNPQTVIAWGEREPKVVFLGRLYPAKGVHTLIESWRAWGQRAPKLELIGDGPDRSALAQKIKTLGLEEKISLLGQLSFSEAQERLARSQLLILPSLCFEGFPMVICEAFALGVPVAASRLGSLPGIVTEGLNGVLFGPGDASQLLRNVKEVWEAPVKLSAMGREALQEFNRNYSSDANYQTLMQIYSSAMANRRRKGLEDER